VDQAFELMATVTEAYIILCAMKLCDMESISNTPQISAEIDVTTDDGKSEFLLLAAKKIVSYIWFTTNTTILREEDLRAAFPYCCRNELEEDMMACDMGQACPKGEWFHYGCVAVDEDNIPEQWFCSNSCKGKFTVAQSRKRYKRRKGQRGKAHQSALVREELESSSSTDDFKERHSRALTWAGLNLLCRRDAVRENDGPDMLRHWRLDLANFMNYNHPKYTILAHRLIASKYSINWANLHHILLIHWIQPTIDNYGIYETCNITKQHLQK
jgi:hypothetical protein